LLGLQEGPCGGQDHQACMVGQQQDSRRR
jgi:hypothetical protein